MEANQNYCCGNIKFLGHNFGDSLFINIRIPHRYAAHYMTSKPLKCAFRNHIITHHNGHAYISAFAYRLNKRYLAQEREIIFIGQVSATVFTKNVIFIIRATPPE